MSGNKKGVGTSNLFTRKVQLLSCYRTYLEASAANASFEMHEILSCLQDNRPANPFHVSNCIFAVRALLTSKALCTTC